MPDPTPVHSPRISTAGAMLLAIMVIGISLRLAAAWGNPWLDEIWSWNIARTGELLAPSDNNHFLNTLWLWTVQDVPSGIVWRLPAVICGGVSIWMTAVILIRFGKAHALIGALLMAVSQPMVMYQSEARGYAGMLLCMLAAIELQLRLNERTTRRRRLGMLAVCVLGAMSHLGFLLVYPFLLGWALITQWNDRGFRAVAIAHMPIVLMLGSWWCFFGRSMAIGGGPVNDPWRMLSAAADATVGLPLGAVTALVMVIAAIRLTGRRFGGLVVTLAAIAVLFPLIVVAMKGSLVFVRYFLPAMLALILLMSVVIGELWLRMENMPRARSAFACTVAALLVLQVVSLRAVLVGERDLSAAALAYIVRAGGDRTVASVNDFQLRTIADFYAAQQGGNTPVEIVPISTRPDWLVRMRLAENDEIRLSEGVWKPVATFPAPSWSGIPWVLFRRVEPASEGFPAHATAK